MILARRLLHRWEAGGAPLAIVHRGGERRHCGAGFARGQLRLQAFEAPPSWAAAADEEEPPCAVCLEPVLTGRVVAGPACLHRLHEACALQLATSAGFQHCVCPTCRAPLLAVNCRAPGEAGCAAAGDDDTEEEEDEAPQRGISAQARPALNWHAPTRVLTPLLARRIWSCCSCCCSRRRAARGGSAPGLGPRWRPRRATATTRTTLGAATTTPMPTRRSSGAGRCAEGARVAASCASSAAAPWSSRRALTHRAPLLLLRASRSPQPMPALQRPRPRRHLPRRISRSVDAW